MKINRALVIAPHYDDETIGCGGTIQKLLKEKKEVFILVLSDPSGYVNNKKDLNIRYKEISKIKKFYKKNKFFELNYPASKIYKIDKSKFIDDVSDILNKVKPDTIFLNHFNDSHSDHRVIFDNLRFFMKSFRYNYIKNILMMEIISETDQGLSIINQTFKPNIFINIEKYFNLKIKASKIYKSQIGNPPFPRSIENIKALATLRGAQSGYKYAEAFMLIRNKID